MDTSRRVEITKDKLRLLKQERERTGVAPQKLLKGTRASRPHGLSASIVSSWLNGIVTSAKPDYLNWVIEQYAKIPPQSANISITAEMHERLCGERERTGIGSVKLLSDPQNPVPHGLTPPMLNMWFARTSKSAQEDHWNFVMSEYAYLPDKGKTNIQQTSRERVLLTPKFKDSLNLWRSVGLLPTFFFENNPNEPEGFTKSVLSNWLSGTSQTGLPLHIEYVERVCSQYMLDRDLLIPVTRPLRTALRTVWTDMGDKERHSLPAILTAQIDKLLKDTYAEINPKEWQKLIQTLKWH